MKVSELGSRLPDGGVMEGLEAVAERDPVVWSMINRRVKGQPVVYDNSRRLTREALGELARRVVIKSDYEDELHNRLLFHRPYQREPLRDRHKHKVYQKGRQTGFTEVEANEVFHFLATHPGTKAVTCVPDDAEILTQRGWLHHDQVVDGDQTLVLDPDTHEARWEPILEIRRHPWSGTLDRVGPFLCTDEHRWPVRERNAYHRGTPREFANKVVRAQHLNQRHTLVRHASSYRAPEEGLLTPRLAAILGWAVTDGTFERLGPNNARIQLYQSSKKHLAEIEELVGRHGRKAHAWSEDPTIEVGPKGGRIVGYADDERPLYGDGYVVLVKPEDVRAIAAAGYEGKDDLVRIIPQLAAPALEAMYDAMMKADGFRSGPRGESKMLAKRDPRVRDAFQILCALLGKAANLNERGLYVIEPTSRSARMRAIYTNRPGAEYHGFVWCPRTPSGTWYMRQGGRVVFTGNTFPRDKQLIDFSNTRVAPAFSDSPRMARLAGVPSQVFTRRVGESYWLFRSAWDSNLGEGIDADMVVLDEKDRMRDKIEVAFKESLKSSRYGLFREISTPTLPNQGINAPFSASDQRVWMVRCSRCNEAQEITHTDNIVQVKDFPLGAKELPPESYDYLCRRQACRGKLDRVFTGEWVARHPDRQLIRGYHIPQLIAPWISATQVMQDKITMRFKELWLCYVCGIPASGELEMVSDDDFRRACAGHGLMAARPATGWSHVSVGIDWGQLNWVVVMGKSSVNQRTYIIGIAVIEDTDRELESAEKVYRYIMPFAPDVVIADAGYGKDRNALLLRRLCPTGTEGRFWAQWYNSSVKHGKTFVPEWSDEARARVTVDRTLTLKNVCRALKEPEFGIPSLEIREVQLLVQHLKSLAPFREIDDETKEIVETVKSSGDDHLAHALASAILGMEKLEKSGNFSFSFE